MNTPSFVIIGCTNLDVNEYPDRVLQSLGGGGYFSAIGASTVIPQVGIFTRIGGDVALEKMSRFAQDGIVVLPDKTTTKSIQTYSDALDLTQRQIRLEPGVSFDITLEEWPASWQDAPKHVHISTLPPLLQRELIEGIRARFPAATISLDTDSWFFDTPEFIPEIATNLQLVDIVFLNRTETAQFSEIIPLLPHAILKLDADGAMISEFGVEVARASAPAVVVADATGAGDVLAGSYLALRSLGKSAAEALEQACATASTAISQLGLEHLFSAKN